MRFQSAAASRRGPGARPGGQLRRKPLFELYTLRYTTGVVDK